jgi:hypothetical protein
MPLNLPTFSGSRVAENIVLNSFGFCFTEFQAGLSKDVLLLGIVVCVALSRQRRALMI